MSLTLFIFCVVVAGLLLLLAWAVKNPGEQRKAEIDPRALEENGRRHATYSSQILRAMSAEDRAFLSSRGGRSLERRVRQERRRIALHYLASLKEDFRRLLRLATAIAVLSPQVAAAQEFERLQLTAKFSLRYQMLRLRLYAGAATLPQLNSLTGLVSGLAVRLDAAMKELGERAALAAELASSLDSSGMGAA